MPQPLVNSACVWWTPSLGHRDSAHTTAMAKQPLKGPVHQLLSKMEQGLEKCTGEGKGP